MRYVCRNTHHPTEKPEPLMAELIAKCPRGVIVDPFMGSGTTLVAAKRLGVAAVGIEREERYCEIAAKRLAQGSLFVAGAESEPEPSRSGGLFVE
jgi:DNA modification methylase